MPIKPIVILLALISSVQAHGDELSQKNYSDRASEYRYVESTGALRLDTAIDLAIRFNSGFAATASEVAAIVVTVQ